MNLKVFIAKVFLKPILLLAFKSRYLHGKWFDDSIQGYGFACRAFLARNVFRLARTYPWPVCLGCQISDPDKIKFDLDDLNNFQSPGTYFQNFSATITLGKGTYIAPNVGIITANHDLNDLKSHLPGEPVTLGEECWVGMNSVILPGVELGPKTVVAAGSVVTKSFIDGHVVIAGSPAKVIKRLD